MSSSMRKRGPIRPHVQAFMTGGSSSPIRIGVSSCLIGQRVRYNGEHKRDSFIIDVLGRFFELVPVCPEVGIGLGVPRPPIQLVSSSDGIRAVGVDNKQLDVTAPLAAYGRRVSRELQGISGYILKSRSPSCGIRSVKVSSGRGRPSNKGTGVFARELIERQPLLPTEEEIRLNDLAIRGNFIERVFCYRRWQDLLAAGLTRGKLASFHSAHRLMFMAHGSVSYQQLERFVTGARAKSVAKAGRLYARAFMEALKRHATPRSHSRALRYAFNCLENKVASDDREELARSIEAFRLGRLPLIVPITLLNHHLRHFPHPQLTNQVYLKASAQELLLRYHT